MNIICQLLISSFLLNLGFCFLPASFTPEKDILFLLRIRNRQFNEEEKFTLETKDNLKSGAFTAAKPTVFLIHGFTEDRRVKHHLLLSK